MSPPYRIVNFYYETLVSFHDAEPLETVVAVARLLRERQYNVTVHGDNVDLDCADGLNQDERETVEGALG